jgi:two-component system phosphate regulon sensor histidine kinase PhoR
VQSLWIYNSVKLSEKHFDYRISLVLKDVVNEIDEHTLVPSKLLPVQPTSLLDIVAPYEIDSLLNKYTKYQNINIPFEFAIVRSSDDSILYASKNWKMYPDATLYKACFSMAYSKEHHYISLLLPQKEEFIFKELIATFSLTIIFIFLVTYGYVYVIRLVFKQKKNSEIRTDFINNMTHEFKTPISTISLASEILKNGSNTLNSDKIKMYAQMIYHENQRMRKQVDLVLQMSLLQNENHALNKTGQDITELIKAAVKSQSIEHANKEVSIQYNFIGNNKTQVDALHITNVILNLLDNAVKYSGAQAKIEIEVIEQDQTILIKVKDNGPGITKEEQERIFDKFYRVHTGNIHNIKGFGLGLAYVKSIVEAHNGEIGVISEISKGSTFWFTLPIIRNENKSE